MRYFRLLLVLLAISCKNVPGQVNEPSAAIPDQESLLENLYQHFITAPTSQSEIEQNEIIAYCDEKSLPLKRSESGLFYMITEEGNSAKPKWGSKVSVQYTGRFLDDRIFDSSYDKRRPLITYVGEGIEGWNEALQIIDEGGKMIAILPSHLAYGESGFTGIIQPNTILRFDIHLEKILTDD